MGAEDFRYLAKAMITSALAGSAVLFLVVRALTLAWRYWRPGGLLRT